MAQEHAPARDPLPEAGFETRLPVALLKIWPLPVVAGLEGGPPGDGEAGITWLRPDLAAVTPVAGDPAVYDAAVRVGAGLLERAALFGQAGSLRLVILPGQVFASASGELRLADDPLLAELESEPPRCPSGAVHLTSYGACRLERRRQLVPAGAYRSPSGVHVPLLEAAAEDPQAAPWRNPLLLRRRLAYVPRPAVDRELAAAEVARVSGPLGSGKTRAVWEAIQEHGGTLWLSARPRRHRGPSLARQLLRRLGAAAGTPDEEPRRALSLLTQRAAEGPLTVVADDLEGATGDDLELVCRLAAEPPAGLRLLLVARSGWRPPASCPDLPTIRVPPMTRTESETLAERAFAGIDLPPAVIESFLGAAAGHPFALEELLPPLVHDDRVRQVYGSFFFRGSRQVDERPSERLIQHVYAEALRLGELDFLRTLAIAATALPAAAVAAVLDDGDAGSPSAPPPTVNGLAGSGLVDRRPSPWGEALAFTCSAHATALASTTSRARWQQRRQALGRELASSKASSGRSAALWPTYRLLAGTHEAVPLLLAVAQRKQAPTDELLEALVGELERHRKRRGESSAELELLWQLLPLARRLGRLQDYGDELPRALALAGGERNKLVGIAALKAELEERQGRLGEAERTLKKVLAKIGLTAGAEPSVALLMIRLARLLIRQGQYGEARKLLEPLVPILEREDAAGLTASCRFYLGNVALHQNRFEDAHALHRQALDARRRLAAGKPAGVSLSALGSVTLRLGRYAEALECYREATRIFGREAMLGEVGIALLGEGEALTRLGDFTAASAPLRRALELRRGGDDPAGVAIARLAVAHNHLHHGNLEKALEEARQAHFELSMASGAPALADAEQLLGRIRLLQNNPGEAITHLATALAGHQSDGAAQSAAFDLAFWLGAVLEQNEKAEVQRLTAELEAALGSAGPVDQQEILDYRLYEGLDWLAQRGEDGLTQDALYHLRRAYRALLRKAELLPRNLRHRFLFLIPDHEKVIEAATRQGLSWPGY